MTTSTKRQKTRKYRGKKITYVKDGEVFVKRRRPSFKAWQDKRFKVWCRDRYKCVHCGKQVNFKDAHIDHIIPVSKGGSDRLSNLRTLDIVCHALRRDPTHDKLRRKCFDKGLLPPGWITLLWDD